MSSWVRYCVAVYVGLLISGALVKPAWVPAYSGEAGAMPQLPEAAKPPEPVVAPHPPPTPTGLDSPSIPGRSATLDA